MSDESAAACPFCLEAIKPGAPVCRHCRSNLAPLHALLSARANLEARVVLLETQLTGLQARVVIPEAADAVPATAPPHHFGWPHMVDNLFLGLAALLAAHWLASTMPGPHQALYRLVALGVSLPFGFRYEIHAKAGAAGQVLAAGAFGIIGTGLILTLDAVLGLPPQRQGSVIAASVALIGLAHLTGSGLARLSRRGERRIGSGTVHLGLSAALVMLVKTEPEKIKGRVDALQGIFESSAPLIAGAAAAWAAFGKVLS